MKGLLTNCCKSSFQICKDIIDVLCTDGQTDRVRLNALICQLFLGQLRMCRSCRMDNQTLYVCNICEQGKDLQVVDKFMCFCLSALDFKGENRSAAMREIFLIQDMIRMIRQ